MLSELRGSDYSDYIFAGGQRIAKSDTFEDRLDITGTNCSNCGAQYSLFSMPTSSTYGGYVIQSGDHLFFRQYQSGGAHGGMQIAFTNGTNTNWSASDTDGNNLNNDGAQQYWHYRNVDLSSFAGRTISKIYLVQETTTAAGTWHIYYNDISLVSADGTVRPIYTRQTSISLTMSGSSGVTGRNYMVDHLTGLGGQPVYTTNYIHSDHLGSSRMVTSTNGYPTYQATLMPYGYDFEQQPTINNYKFTGQERDAETSFDHFMYRQYANNVARWTSPDPAGMGAVDITNPQTWNRYAYVLNNPINGNDLLGLDECLNDKGEVVGCAASNGGGGGGTISVPGTTVTVTASDPGGMPGGGGGCVEIYRDGVNVGNTCGYQGLDQNGTDPVAGGGSGGGRANDHVVSAVPPGDKQIPEAKGIRCAQSALGSAILAGAADFIGIPRGAPGTFGYDFVDPSNLRAAGVDLAVTGIAALKRPEFQAMLITNITRIAGHAAAGIAEKSIPVVGWVLGTYQAVHAVGEAVDAYKEKFDQCVADPNS